MPNPTTLMEQIGENRYSNPKLKFHKLLTKCWLLNNRKVSVRGLCAALLYKWNLSLPTNTASLLPLPLLRPFTISESTPLPLPLKINTFSGFQERSGVQPLPSIVSQSLAVPQSYGF
ncbi:unnamed protein product [Prunus armeniaca]